MVHLTRFGLLLAALVLAVVLGPLGIVGTFVYSVLRLFVNPRYVLNYLSQSALSLALSIDLMGNVICKDAFNATMRKQGGYGFGQYNETISSVLGKNKALGTLTDFGRLVANLLNFFDPGHVERAANND